MDDVRKTLEIVLIPVQEGGEAVITAENGKNGIGDCT